MFFRFGSKAGAAVPPPQQAVQDIHTKLSERQQLWADLLARDPAALADLEQEIHSCFGQFADQLVASLLAAAAAQPALGQAAQKK
jgi:hypothetical protein